MSSDLRAMLGELPYLLGGIKITLIYATLSVFFGFLGGILLATLRLSPFRFLRTLATSYISIFRGTPLLLQLFLIYFSLPQILNCNISPFFAGLVTFSLNSSAYVAEILRSGIQSVPSGQVEVARVMGCSSFQIFRDIVFPQALRNVLPALINEIAALIKESAIISTIGEADLLRRANSIASHYYLYLPPLLTAGICYYLLIFFVTALARIFERKLACSR